MVLSLNNRVFALLNNTEVGEAGTETVFRYFQQDDVIWGEYAGGNIKKGLLIGKFIEPTRIRITYQHLNRQMENRIGQCISEVEVLPSGKIRLHEAWQWLDGRRESGESVIEEI
ncbi:hypothetical protein EDC44_11912 [Cricetibacter osteomyelitidis]|uniref:N-acetylglutamate synthase n=1 Tax=Cricetibacter osteomyelitidis TaxID=1521931 RepID=A0A4R2SY55_9PAST|nr:n-acetylglutamate synthase [Cricetibacter osteomyelitidis]TCP93414.1 hypothetical protein EDC44_11912 [Cricetibacter osteomyelitidis]